MSPLNLFLKWGEINAYVGGIFSDYLLQKLWLSEIPLLLAIILWLPKKIIREKGKIILFLKKNKAWFSLLIFFIARQFFTPLPIISIWYLLKTIELGLFIWCIKDNWQAINQPLLSQVLLLSLLLQITVGLLQFHRQQALFPYMILGETQLAGTINIARANFKIGEVILPYGTTAHPNILTGTIMVTTFIWLELRTRVKKTLGWLELIVFSLSCWLIFLTQSMTAFLAMSLFLSLQIFPKLKVFGSYLASNLLVLLPLFIFLIPATLQTESLFRRNFLNSQAFAISQEQPIAGVGLGLFTTTLKTPSAHFGELVRFVQPAHNVPLLLLAETGIVGLLLVFLTIKKYFWPIDAPWLVLLSVLLSLDHYLVTQWAGGVLLALILATKTQKLR
ncbi:MAG TPA: O-antigen ligase family protein [Patescibacteria group bacterium]